MLEAGPPRAPEHTVMLEMGIYSGEDQLQVQYNLRMISRVFYCAHINMIGQTSGAAYRGRSPWYRSSLVQSTCLIFIPCTERMATHARVLCWSCALYTRSLVFHSRAEASAPKLCSCPLCLSLFARYYFVFTAVLQGWIPTDSALTSNAVTAA